MFVINKALLDESFTFQGVNGKFVKINDDGSMELYGNGLIKLTEAGYAAFLINVTRGGALQISDASYRPIFDFSNSKNESYKDLEAPAIVLKSPSGKRFRVTVDDNGNLQTTQL